MGLAVGLVGLVVALAVGPALGRLPAVDEAVSPGAPWRVLWHRWRPGSNAGGLADLVLLVAVGLLSGLSVSLTCRKIVRTVETAEAAMLAAAVERQRRGQPLIEALGEIVNAGHPGIPDQAGAARMIALLRSQVEDGAPVAEDLVELSGSLRDDARRRAETRARRLPVRMLLPLIICVLPGFLSLTVAPVIIESLRGVAL